MRPLTEVRGRGCRRCAPLWAGCAALARCAVLAGCEVLAALVS